MARFSDNVEHHGEKGECHVSGQTGGSTSKTMRKQVLAFYVMAKTDAWHPEPFVRVRFFLILRLPGAFRRPRFGLGVLGW